MRAVWMPSLFTRYSPNLDYIAKVLPDVMVLEVIFAEFTIDSRFEPHIARECNFTFENGRTLNIPGYMLWKFLDMIPEPLGSEATGYFDHNMFSPDYGERLMERIRAAYQALFVDTPPKGMPSPPPVRCVFNLKTGASDVQWMKKLSDESAKYLSAAFLDSQDQFEEVLKVGAFVREETSEQQFELGFKDLGNGMMGRTRIHKPWPDLSLMKFEEFMGCMSAKRRDDCPAQKFQNDLFSEVLMAESEVQGLKFVKWLRGKEVYAKMAKEIGCTTANPMPGTFIRHLKKSEHAFIFFDSLWSHVYGLVKPLSVKEVLEL
jgi:hypothetical protein